MRNNGYKDVRCCTKQQPGLLRELSTVTSCLQWRLHEQQQNVSRFCVTSPLTKPSVRNFDTVVYKIVTDKQQVLSKFLKSYYS